MRKRMIAAMAVLAVTVAVSGFSAQADEDAGDFEIYTEEVNAFADEDLVYLEEGWENLVGSGDDEAAASAEGSISENDSSGDTERKNSILTSDEGKENAAESTEQKDESLPEGMCRSYLTGKVVPESIGRKRPVALMIENDLHAAEWQRGTGNAEVMYEARVEGGITRMEGIFEDYKDLSMIMPIRSCRPQFVYYAREFDAYYGHYGQVIYAVPILQYETNDIAGIPYGEDGQVYELIDGSSAYSRDHEGVTGIYTTYDKIQTFVQSQGWNTDYSDSYKGHYRFAEDGKEVELTEGKTALVVLPGFVSNHARFDYDMQERVYYRSEFGEPQIDHLTNKQLTYKNVILQIGPSAMLDDHYLFTDPVNGGQSGRGWYITNGRAEEITWKKENWSSMDPVLFTVTAAYLSFDVRNCDYNVTRYYDMNGEEIVLNQGKTFVEIIREEDSSKVVISDDPYIDSYVIDGM